MATIDIRDEHNEKYHSPLSLYINGVLIQDAKVWAHEHLRFVDVFESSAVEALTQLRFDQLPDEWFITMPSDIEWLGYSMRIHLIPRDREIDFDFTPDTLNWAGPWSIMTFSQATADVVNNLERDDIVGDASPEGMVQVRVNFVGDTIAESIAAWRPLLDVFPREAKRELAGTSDAVVVQFRFPPHVKIACEQYLLYFAEFLADIGVTSTTDLHEEAGSVIFSVTPTASRDALSRIREALEVYLGLPGAAIADMEPDLESSKLLANIYHLRSQLTLARAIAETQHQTIRAQETTIALQEQLLVPNHLAEAGRVIPREEFLGGTIALTKYAGKGFEINLPEIFRRLKNTFKS